MSCTSGFFHIFERNTIWFEKQKLTKKNRQTKKTLAFIFQKKKIMLCFCLIIANTCDVEKQFHRLKSTHLLLLQNKRWRVEFCHLIYTINIVQGYLKEFPYGCISEMTGSVPWKHLSMLYFDYNVFACFSYLINLCYVEMLLTLL